jgi:hypothetical protein
VVEGLGFDADRETFEVIGGARGPRDNDNARGDNEYSPGTAAPVSANYETVNLFGRRTGHRIRAELGEALPVLPRGFTWALVED